MTRLRGLRRTGLFTLVLLVVLSSVAINFSIAKESSGEASENAEAFESVDLDLEPVNVRGRHKIESGLGDVIDEMISGGRVSDGIRVIVEVEYVDGGLADNLESIGVDVETSHGNLVQVMVTPGQIIRLSGLDYIQMIRTPLIPYQSVSEGVGVMGADVLHGLSINGSGVKVAILDLGFRGYTSLLGTELPSSVITESFSAAGGIEATNLPADSAKHGTACAEVVHDVAPGAQLYLVNFDTSVEFLNAMDWLINTIKLSEDNDKKIPFSASLVQIMRTIVGDSRPFREVIIGAVGGATGNFYCTPNFWPKPSFTSFWGENVPYTCTVNGGDGGKGELFGESTIFNYALAVEGYAPHGAIEIPFGLQDDPDDWYDVSGLGSLKLDILSGAGRTSADTVQIFLQQLRKYAA